MLCGGSTVDFMGSATGRNSRRKIEEKEEYYSKLRFVWSEADWLVLGEARCSNLFISLMQDLNLQYQVLFTFYCYDTRVAS